MFHDQVALRPVHETDLPLLDRFALDPEYTSPFQWFGYTDPGRLRRQWADNGLLGDDGGRLMVVRGAERLGFMAWRKVVTGTGSFCWNIGIILLPGARGRGYGAEAQRLLARYLFAHTQAMRVEADTEVSNVAAQRALEKAGFTREGILRSYTFRDGEWRDAVVYSILRNEI
ncbi:GNAT family protein [Actinomadura keratinilytica]|jgi:RimJ/RimL family protein N-acetyltransferase|uniref:GNAT family N-acetyltransferase n=1 Tax=Actinomadura keratinilytica TaxID=547461 RepID=UPI0031EB5F3B